MASTASTTGSQAMTPTLPLPKKRHQLWIHQTVILDTTSAAPNILTQVTSPTVNVYKRGGVAKLGGKPSEDDHPQITRAKKIFSGKFSDLLTRSVEGDLSSRSRYTHEAVPEEDQITEEKEILANGHDAASLPPPLPSPTKRVTFMERVQGLKSSPHNYSVDGANDDRRKLQFQPPLPRRVRKSKTLDAVMVSSTDRPSSPRNHVMDFFNQIRTSPNAPWKSSPPSSNTVDASSSGGRPPSRSFTLGLKTFANFRQPQQQDEPRKTGRHSLRIVDGKEKRKRTQSYSFRTPNWLNSKPKLEQQNTLRSDPPVLKPIIRKRSISASNLHLLIMRQTSSEPEIVAALHRTDNAYQEILSNFSCYDLMPQQGVVIGFDIRYTGRQALLALASNDVRVALLWDFASGGTVGVLTATDLLRLLADHKLGVSTETAPNEDGASSPCPCGEDILEKPLMASLYACPRSKKTKRPVASVGCEASLRAAVSLLLDNRYHRLAVTNSKTGDVLYFLSRRKVLHCLMHHMSTLPTPAVLRRTLGDLHLGAWRPDSQEDSQTEDAARKVLSTTVTESLTEVVNKFLSAGISALPVLGENERIIDSLSKYDVIYYLTSNADKGIDLKTVVVEEILHSRREGFKRTITCPTDMPLSFALERLIKTDSRRIYVVSSDGAFRAVVSITDVLSYLMA